MICPPLPLCLLFHTPSSMGRLRTWPCHRFSIRPVHKSSGSIHSLLCSLSRSLRPFLVGLNLLAPVGIRFRHRSLCTSTSVYTNIFLFFLIMTSYQMSVRRPDTQAILRELAAGLDSLPKDVTILAKPALTTILELTQSSNLTHPAAIEFLKKWLSRLDSSSRLLKRVFCPIFSLHLLWARLPLRVMIIGQCPWHFTSSDSWDF